MQIYLIRHGQTQWNKTGKYQGTMDIPLSEEGIADLRQAEFSPEKVYVTHLQRTVQTAKAIFPDARLITEDGFREMNFGDFEGRSYKDMENDAAYRAWVDSGCLDRCPNGEDRIAFADRIEETFDKVMKKAAAEGKDRIVIVAHGGTQMALLDRFALPHKEYWQWLTPNGCGYLINADEWEEKRQLTIIREVSFCKSNC